MKALALILIGAVVGAGSVNQFLDARSSDAPIQASLWFAAIVAGGIIALVGLVMNHREHTRRR